ncbi:MAG: hypothetical protein WEC75_00475 [Dehalococcoidia bacterium]
MSPCAHNLRSRDSNTPRKPDTSYRRVGSSTPKRYIGLESGAPLEAFEEIAPRWPVFRITQPDQMP